MRQLALLLVLVTAPALAQEPDVPRTSLEPPRFVVVPLGDDALPRVQPLYAALEAVGAASIPREARAGLDLPLAPGLYQSATLDEPRDALLSARAARRELALEAVDAHLDDALAHALRLPNPAEHVDLLADILLLRAELALARGQSEEALFDLRLLARLDPRRTELHPGLFPPNLVAAYERARALSAEAEPGYLTLQGESGDVGDAPPTLLLDGEEVPLADARRGLLLASGPHLVTLRAPGFVSRSFLVEVSALQPLFLEARLFPPGADEARAAALAAFTEAPDDDEALARLLDASGATAALVLSAGHAFTFARARGRVSLVDREDALALARAALEAATPPPIAAAATSPQATSPTPPDEGGALGFWPLAISGGVVAGALAAVAVSVGVLAWLGQPAAPTQEPPRPVVIGCCGQGR